MFRLVGRQFCQRRAYSDAKGPFDVASWLTRIEAVTRRPRSSPPRRQPGAKGAEATANSATGRPKRPANAQAGPRGPRPQGQRNFGPRDASAGGQRGPGSAPGSSRNEDRSRPPRSRDASQPRQADRTAHPQRRGTLHSQNTAPNADNTASSGQTTVPDDVVFTPLDSAAFGVESRPPQKSARRPPRVVVSTRKHRTKSKGKTASQRVREPGADRRRTEGLGAPQQDTSFLTGSQGLKLLQGLEGSAPQGGFIRIPDVSPASLAKTLPGAAVTWNTRVLGVVAQRPTPQTLAGLLDSRVAGTYPDTGTEQLSLTLARNGSLSPESRELLSQIAQGKITPAQAANNARATSSPPA